eukprot:6207382-Pleurochrysis_carterae.AAC.3
MPPPPPPPLSVTLARNKSARALPSPSSLHNCTPLLTVLLALCPLIRTHTLRRLARDAQRRCARAAGTARAVPAPVSCHPNPPLASSFMPFPCRPLPPPISLISVPHDLAFHTGSMRRSSDSIFELHL